MRRKQGTLTPAERDLVVSTLRHFEGRRFVLHAFVVMDDHVHVVVTPEPGVELEQVVHSWKSFAAWRLQRECGRVGPIWRDESYDRIVRTEWELAQKVAYVLRNPLRRWPEAEHYPWVWALGVE